MEFKMPKLGESVTEGTVGRWLKQPGDAVELYEPLLEVTTDKVDTEVPSPVNGTLDQILVEEGDTVPVGTVIAVLTSSDEAVVAPASAEAVPVQREDEVRPVQTTAPRAASDVGFVSPVVARIAAEHNVDLAQVMGTGRDGRITKKDVRQFVEGQASQPKPQPAPMPTGKPSGTPVPMPTGKPSGTPVPMPTVGGRSDGERRLPTQTVSYSLPAVSEPADRADDGSGRAAAAAPVQPSAPPTLGQGDELVPLNSMRRAIAEHMVRSKRTAPHVTTVMEADLSAVVEHRAGNKAEFERQNVKLTFTPYFVQACVAALREVPIVNATYTDEGILMHSAINIGVAVALADGLIVPVIHDADDKSLLGLARAVNDLAERARTRRLTADETADGTFTITNHGVSGSLFAMPVINQPQAAILGVGAIQKRATVISQNGTDAIAIRPMCYLSLTFDHRLIDGSTADQFLSVTKRELESWG